MTRRTVLLGGGGAVLALALPLAPRESAAASTAAPVLQTEALAKLAEDGLEPDEVPLVDGFAALMLAAGGTAWAWRKPATELSLDIVRLTVEPGSRERWTRELELARFDVRPGSTEEFVARDPQPTGLRPVALLRGESLTLVSVPDFAKWIA